MLHHDKSPSKSGIWAHCAGAPEMWQHAPALFSNVANEGTGAHSILENCLKSGVKPEFFLGGTIWVDGDEIKIDDEMVEALDQCLDVIVSYSCTWWCAELKINIPQIAEGYYGHADFIAYNEVTGKLIIFDFKYGRVSVPVLDNPQLLLYAIGACTLPNISTVNEIELCVVQPRDYNAPVKREIISHNRLAEWCVWLNNT
jgi:hypothetical protein